MAIEPTQPHRQPEHLAEAISQARMQRQLNPRDAEAAGRLGRLLQQDGQGEQALPHLEAACRLAPKSATHLNNLGTARLALGRWALAAHAYRQAVALNPNVAHIWMGLANALLEMENVRESLEASERSLELAPGDSRVVDCRMRILARAGCMADAVAVLEAHLRDHPTDQRSQASLAFHLNYLPGDPAETLRAHRRFGEMLPKPEAPPRSPRSARRPLRIGLLSSDLWSHAVGCFAQAILAMDAARAEIVAFASGLPHPDDPRTQGLRSRAYAWHEVGALSDDALESLLRRSELDVLLELNGLSEGERLLALARKPVPCMVTAIGYPNTTGVPAIDARLVDSITDPPGSEAMATERLLRIDPCFLCYDPPAGAPEPALPAPGTPLTFGSFNNMMKISDPTVDAWAALMRAQPHARLLLKSPGLGDAWNRQRLLARFETAGVQPGRIEACGPTADARQHLAMYQRIHVALDTFPYNGTTTTCEALWMGVPVVTYLGDRHAARVSASLLHAAGHPEWIASGPGALVRVASELAEDSNRLAVLRGTLRAELRASPLLDAPAWADRLLFALDDLYSTAP